MMLRRLIFLFCLLVLSSSVCAAESGAYYIEAKLKGYAKGEFVVLADDKVNFRSAPETGAVIKTLPHHSLLRVLAHRGAWLEADADGTHGYIYADFTGAGTKDELTEEDFTLGDAALGESFDEKSAAAELGVLQASERDKKNKRTNYSYAGCVIGVTGRRQAVEAITVRDAKFITMRGISVGDSAGRAVGQYGVPDSVVYAADKVIYEYFWRDEKQERLRFALEVNHDSRVSAIVLEKLKK